MGKSVEKEPALDKLGQKKGKKSKKGHCKANTSDEILDCAGGVPKGMKDNLKLSKDDNRKEKEREKAEVYNDELHATYKENVSEVDDNYPKEKVKKKKKKKERRLKPVRDNDYSNTGALAKREEKKCLQTDGGKDLGNGSEFKARKEKKKMLKEHRKKNANEFLCSTPEIYNDKNVEKDGVGKGQKHKDEMKDAEIKTDKKKKKKKRRDEGLDSFNGKNKTEAVEECGKAKENYEVDVNEKVENKKRKREKKKGKDNLGCESIVVGDQKFKDSKGASEDPKSNRKLKKVRFSGHVDVFPSSDGGKVNDHKEGLVQGKRFSLEEDEMVKEAVFKYIEDHGLGEEGLNMVLKCQSHPEIRHCWREIGAALPYRPHSAVYYRAHILFERDENRSWTAEELEMVKKFYGEHGPQWKKLADELGKHRVHLKDAWRRIKLPNLKKGNWSQDEYQNLFDLVNKDLRLKAFEEKKSKYGMLRDNISWSAISDKLSTRTGPWCCIKWYNQLTSPMVAQGLWDDADDYRLLDALYSLDAACIEDVDWDNLLDHRSGDLCMKRWKQMVNHIGEHGTKSFAEQVETLSKRYCPDLLEAREEWDSRPFVS
ncbi:hypothetical protein NMG60_11014735 [Bertholletia excelsa]